MKISKEFGCSALLISILGIFAGYFNFTLIAVLFVLILALSNDKELRNDIATVFFTSLIVTVVCAVLGGISLGYNSILNTASDIIFNSVKSSKAFDVINAIFTFLRNVDLASILNGFIGFVHFIISIVFVVMVCKQKTLTFPGISKLVEKTIFDKE